MPDSYKNPSINKSMGNFSWEPKEYPTGENTTFGYNSLTIARGKFINELTDVVYKIINKESDSPNGYSITTNTKSNIKNDDIKLAYPFLSSFRTLNRPSITLPYNPTENDNILVSGSDFFYDINFKLKNNGMRGLPISSVVFEYSLTIDVNDSSLQSHLTGSDKKLLSDYLSKKTNTLNIDWSQYMWGQILGEVSSNTATINGFKIGDSTSKTYEFPIKTNDKLQQISITDVDKINPNKKISEIKFGTGGQPSNYPVLDSLRFCARFPINSLKFYIYKISLYSAARVNIPKRNLPCKLLSYVMPISFKMDPKGGSLFYPTSTEPTVSIKVFSPEEKIGVSGFAHSIALRFLLFAIPIYGISPLDYSLAGLLTDIAGGGSVFATIFIGPVAGKKTLKLAFTGAIIVGGKRIVYIRKPNLNKNPAKLELEQALGYIDTTAPTQTDTSWSKISEYDTNTTTYDDTSGPWAFRFSYINSTLKATDWYRIKQLFSSGPDLYSIPFKNDLYTEKTALSMVESSSAVNAKDAKFSIERDAVFLSQIAGGNFIKNAKPILIFVSDSNPVSNQVVFEKGSWILKFNASLKNDSDNSLTYVVARFWLMPDTETIDPSNPHKYRDKNELFFQSSNDLNTSSYLTYSGLLSTPPTMDDFFISSPLSSTDSEIEITRFVDNFKLNSINASDQGILSQPFPNAKSVLVVGFYMLTVPKDNFSYPTNSLDIPQVIFNFDANVHGIQTSIYQVLSNDGLFAQQWYRYKNSYFKLYPQNSTLSLKTYSGSKVSSTGYFTYDKKIKNYNVNIGNNALTDLNILETNTLQPLKVTIPIINVSDSIVANEQIFKYSDFVLDGPDLTLGKVDNKSWKISFNSIYNVKDNKFINYDFQLEGLLVTSNGKIIHRIFKSNIIKGTLNSNKLIEYDFDITYPFDINGYIDTSNFSETRFILRMYVYPYKVKLGSLDIALIQTDLEKDNLVIGPRIELLTIKQNTLLTLEINRSGIADDAPGTEGFYEALPLLSNNTLGGNQFLYLAQPEDLKTLILFGSDSRSMGGQLYSPIQYINLPSNMEAEVSSIFGDNIFVRTVPVNSIGNSTEESTVAIHDTRNSKIHVFYDQDTSLHGLNFGTLSTGRVIKHLEINGYLDKNNEDNISSNIGLSKTLYDGQYPTVSWYKRTLGINQGSILALYSQTQENNKNYITNIINSSPSRSGNWGRLTSSLDDNSNQKMLIDDKLTYTQIISSNNNSTQFLIGYSLGGIYCKPIILGDAPLQTDVYQNSYFFVDGVQSPDFNNGGYPIISSDSPINETAKETFPSGYIDSHGRIFVFYTIDGQNGIIYGRYSYPNQKFSKSFKLFDFSSLTNSISASLSIYGLSCSYDPKIDIGCLAFWCNGKLLLIKIVNSISANKLLQNQLYFIAGNSNFSIGSAYIDSILNIMKQQGTLIVRKTDSEEDILQQRAGITIVSHAPYAGCAFIYYRNLKGEVLERIFYPTGDVTPAIVKELSS